jgi:prepilin-type processing-associated H-X9-DG protein
MDQLVFNFHATEYNGWPQARVIINHKSVVDFTAHTPSFRLPIDIKYADGVHQLEIQRHSKTDANVLFVDGKVLQDQLLTLESIYFNDVQLANQFLYRGIWCWDGREQPGALTWGVNGSWKWEFGIPFVQWAVDSSQQECHPDLVIPHKNNALILKQKIQRLRNVWQ